MNIRRTHAAAMALVSLLCFALAATAATYTYVGPTTPLPQLWSNIANWSGGTAYPDGKDDVGVLDNDDEQVTYDATCSGVVGGMQITGRKNSQRIIIDADVLVDYTGTTGDATTPGGWIYHRADDNYGSFYVINADKTLTITGFKANTDGNAGRFIYGSGSGSNHGGTLKFRPDGDGKGYLYFGYNKGKDTRGINIDFSDLTVIECMDDDADSVIEGGLTSAAADLTDWTKSKAITIGRTDGATQTFAAPASLAGTPSGAGISLAAYGMSGRYGPKLVVNASGTAGNPNLVVFEKEAFGELAFAENSSRASGGSWMAAAGAGVARLVLEGDFTTGDNSDTDSLWDMSRIELQMAGEEPASQQLKWCGEDLNAGGGGDLMDFSGFTDNYAVRKLIVGSDEGTAANHVDFTTTGEGAAMYVWGLEFVTGGYVTLGNSDYLYYLGTGENVGGIQGMGLTLPGGSLGDFTNRPENIIQLGVPEPATAALLALGLIPLLKRRRRK